MTSPICIAVPPGRVAGAVAIACSFAIVLAGCVPPVGRGPSSEAGPSGSGEAVGSPVDAVPSGPTPIPSFARPTPTPAPTFLAYVVRTGDNLNTIAHHFGTTARSIAYWNRATYPTLDPDARGYRPDLIRIGWSLILIPHVVVDEQTLPEPTPNPTDPSEAGPSDSPAGE